MMLLGCYSSHPEAHPVGVPDSSMERPAMDAAGCDDLVAVVAPASGCVHVDLSGSTRIACASGHPYTYTGIALRRSVDSLTVVRFSLAAAPESPCAGYCCYRGIVDVDIVDMDSCSCAGRGTAGECSEPPHENIFTFHPGDGLDQPRIYLSSPATDHWRAEVCTYPR
jgi:hypothetical protein